MRRTEYLICANDSSNSKASIININIKHTVYTIGEHFDKFHFFLHLIRYFILSLRYPIQVTYAYIDNNEKTRMHRSTMSDKYK